MARRATRSLASIMVGGGGWIWSVPAVSSSQRRCLPVEHRLLSARAALFVRREARTLGGWVPQINPWRPAGEISDAACDPICLGRADWLGVYAAVQPCSRAARGGAFVLDRCADGCMCCIIYWVGGAAAAAAARLMGGRARRMYGGRDDGEAVLLGVIRYR